MANDLNHKGSLIAYAHGPAREDKSIQRRGPLDVLFSLWDGTCRDECSAKTRNRFRSDQHGHSTGPALELKEKPSTNPACRASAELKDIAD